MRCEMKINLKNYEEYFVRYIDDELSRDEVSELNLFLSEHPELISRTMTADEPLTTHRKGRLDRLWNVSEGIDLGVGVVWRLLPN